LLSLALIDAALICFGVQTSASGKGEVARHYYFGSDLFANVPPKT